MKVVDGSRRVLRQRFQSLREDLGGMKLRTRSVFRRFGGEFIIT